MNKLTLVTKLPGKIKIYQDLRNWVLEIGGVNNRSYFPELDGLCEELLNLRLKVKSSESKRLKNDLRWLIKAIEDTRDTVRRDIQQLKKIVTKRDRGFSKRVGSKDG